MTTVGVDIGGTSIKIGVVDTATGSILQSTSFPTPHAPARDFAQSLAEFIRIAIRGREVSPTIGIGVPGAMNAERTLVRNPPNFPGWEEEPLAAYLREALPEFRNVIMDNDAKVATFAEANFGAGQGESHFLLVTLGTGVGGGIWAENQIFRGATGGAGEFGHISIDHQGEYCGCGARGCIEAYIGRLYFIGRARRRFLDERPDTLAAALLDANTCEPEDIARFASSGDVFSRDLLAEAGALLGVACASVAKLLDISLFIVGGGIAQAGDLVLAPARASLAQNVFAHQRNVVRLVSAALGPSAGLIGAAFMASES
jgi:glucokinase